MPQRENNQSSSLSYKLETHLEPIRIVPGLVTSNLQRTLIDRLLPTAKTIEPQKAKREVKHPTRFGKYFILSSIINEEKKPLPYKQASEPSNAEKWLNAMH